MSYVPAVQEWLVTTRTARAGRARQTTSRARTAARGSSSSARFRRTTRSVIITCSGTKHYRHVSCVTFSCSVTRARVRATARAVWRRGPGAARHRCLSRRTSCPGIFTFLLTASCIRISKNIYTSRGAIGSLKYLLFKTRPSRRHCS